MDRFAFTRVSVLNGSNVWSRVFRQPIDNLTPEERDARTVFCMQLAARIRARDLEDFFSAVGKVGLFSAFVVIVRDPASLYVHGSDACRRSLKVRDVRMISDRNSRRSKGIAYIEFVESSSVPLAIGLTGQRLLGVPIIVQASQVGFFTAVVCKSGAPVV